MKKFLILTFLSLAFASCTYDTMESENQPKYRILAYQPKGEPEEILLSNGAKIYMDIDSTYYYQDIIFSREQVEAMMAPVTRSAVIKAKVRYWPNKTIYYKINSGFSNSNINTITSALQTINAYTDIQFIPTNNLPQHHIQFTVTNGSFSSPIGMQDNGNTIELGEDMIKGYVLHEIMHSLGFLHEHSRSDRDSWVNIYWDNIIEGDEIQFYKYTDTGLQGYDVGDFDYNSVMIYGSISFSKNSGYTITRKNNPSDGYISPFSSNLSSGDQTGLKFVYGPEKLHLNTEVSYEQINGDDEYYEYENTVTFLDSNNNPITLNHPRLIVADYTHYVYGDGPGMSTYYTTTEYHVVPTGASSYNLGFTEYLHEEEGYGIIHRHEETYYTLYSY